MIRAKAVGLPGGFTKSGHPLLIFPDTTKFTQIPDSDLLLLLKYYISVIPRNEQSTGFAIVIDRRNSDWDEIQVIFSKIVSIFPAKVKEVFLLYQYPEGKPVLGQLVNDYLLDFDIFHVSHVTELMHYIDTKHLPVELGGMLDTDIDTWLTVQQHVDSFTYSATKIARRLATFVKILNQEDISLHHNRDTMQEVAEKNRNCYKRLRRELEDLTDQGVYMMRQFQESGANLMQRLSVQMLCYQLDNTWQYFTRTFKMQDHLYVQYVELNQFQIEFRELSNKFNENEKIIKKLTVSGENLEEVSAALDELDSVIEALSVDVIKAKNLAKGGQDLIMEHAFSRDCLEPKCSELKIMCKRQELLFLERRRALLKFLDLFESLENIRKWCQTATEHLSRDKDQDRDQDLLSQIRQIDYLMSKSRDIKIKSRAGFEEDFDDIKTLLSAKTVFQVDDSIDELDRNLKAVVDRRELLRSQVGPAYRGDHESSMDLNIKREKILTELLETEDRYVEDMRSILVGYRDKMSGHPSSLSLKVETIFGNLDEIENFHSTCLLPELERCELNSQEVGRTFLEYSDVINRLYCRYCQNMEAARQAVSEVGENNPLLLACQKELGHQLPLSAYLLKPVQRLTKYQLLLKDLSECSYPAGKFELEESVVVILGVIKAVNDSLHQIDIKGLPEILHPLGSLVCQESFSVLTENKSQSQILFRNRQQRRHVLLYENHIVFCKQSGSDYHFKFSLATTNLGMSSIIKNEEKKMELWLTGQSDIYTLEAKTKKSKEDFAAELRKVIVEQKEKEKESSRRSHHPAMFSETMSTTSGSESLRSRRSHLSRSKSLDQGGPGRRNRSRSLDPYQDRSSSEAELLDNEPLFPRYQVLADYMAMTGRELNIMEGETVELIKIGCSGWWFVRLSCPPYSEGWAPSTYLEKLPNKNRTLDRK